MKELIIIKQLDIEKRRRSNELREELYKKIYLSEIISKENPTFSDNSLILAPVGSGKSFLIENILIPSGYKGNILYLTSNTALKDSVSPNNNNTRKEMAKNGESVRFFTTQNENRYGERDYNVHVMTYHEFGSRIFPPTEIFTKDIDLIFCDEIHSLPTYMGYGSNGELYIALRWLFSKHEGKKIYYFTATEDSLDILDSKMPGYMGNVETFNYLSHPRIRRYEIKSIYYIRHLLQVRDHLAAKIDYVKRSGVKGLAFTRRIKEQEMIRDISKEEGYTPITIWSVNNEERKMNEEQLRVREYLLTTGNIPEPYNLLIINNSMQEGWNLFDKKVEFAILNTVDKTEQVQALGRIRKDVDFIVIKTNSVENISKAIDLDDKYIGVPLIVRDKERLSKELSILDNKKRVMKWPGIKKILEEKGYIITESMPTINGKRTRASTISEPKLS